MTEPELTFDVCIVGAGPAGSATAIRLADAGLHVLLVEQKKFPRQKLCGEFISPECLAHFNELGVLPEIVDAGGVELCETVFYSRNGKGVAIESKWLDSSGTMALGLSRAEMDERLVERAREVGVEVFEETIAGNLLFGSGRVIGLRIKGKSGLENEVFAKLTIDATGRTRALARRVDKPAEIRKPASHVAFKTHLQYATISAATCEIFAYQGGYGGCNRVENDLYNMCFIASAKDTRALNKDPERVMREIVFTNKRAAETMKDAVVAGEWLAVPIERFGRGELVPALGLLTVGDAAAFIDPFTGSGILLALESAKMIANAVVNHKVFEDVSEVYRRNYAAAFDRRLRFCSMLRYAAFVPFLADAAISALGLSGRLRRHVARATRFYATGNKV